MMENSPDTSENKTLQSPILSHSEKFYTLGLMTNRIIHEMNNSIQGILLLVNFLKMNYSADETISDLDQEIQKMKNLTHSVLDYIKTNTIEFGPLDLSIIINKTIILLKDITSDSTFTSIETEYPPSVPWIKGNFFHLQQAFLNIFLFCGWVLKHFQSSRLRLEIKHDHLLKLYNVKIWCQGQTTMEKGLPFDEYAEEAKLNLAQKIFRKYNGQLQVSEASNKDPAIIVTLPAFIPTSDQSD